MSDEKKNMGAPASDETSALFVSARKKQLAEQEEERKRQEEEQKRLAAEAEVRRLEAEVEERRRQAEEDRLRAEDEARQIATEAKAKQQQAAANPDAVLSAQSRQPAGAPKQGPAGAAGGGGKNKLFLIGGAVAAAAVIVVILVMVLNGGDGKGDLIESDAGVAPASVASVASQVVESGADSVPWAPVDAAAAFDAVEQLPVLAMDVNYPSSVLEVTKQDSDTVRLGCLDRDATIQVMRSSEDRSSQTFSSEDSYRLFTEINENMVQSLIDNSGGEGEILSSGLVENHAGSYTSEVIGRYTFEDTGVTITAVSWVSAWKNEQTGGLYAYSVLALSHQEDEAEITELAARIFTGLGDTPA